MENNNILNQKRKVIAWVTSPLYAKIILEKAADYAKSRDLELIVISMQNPIGDDWVSRSGDIAIIEKAARSVNAQLIVNFSENTLRAAYDLILENKPVAMFTGVSNEISRSSAFIQNIGSFAEDAVLYSVTNNGDVLCDKKVT